MNACEDCQTSVPARGQRRKTAAECEDKSNQESIPDVDGPLGIQRVERGSKTSAMARGADAEAQGQSVETQSVEASMVEKGEILQKCRGETETVKIWDKMGRASEGGAAVWPGGWEGRAGGKGMCPR